jgi:hypothetical protein
MEFKYKEYSSEEDKIYESAISKIKEAIRNGFNFNEACSIVNVSDPALKRFIVDDALKIMIAEMHYEKNMPLPVVADRLKVPLKAVNIANMEMLEDTGIAAAEMFKKSSPVAPIGNA